MDSQQEEMVRACCIRIGITNKVGTGFFVEPGKALTCAHVIRDVTGITAVIGINVPVLWEREPLIGIVEVVHQEPYPDIVSLHVVDKEGKLFTGAPCVHLGAMYEVKDPCYIPAHSDLRPKGDASTNSIEATVDRQRQIDPESTAEPVIKLKDGQVRPGFSGAPVIDLRRHRVCGMVQHTRGRDTDLGGLALPTAKLFTLFPGLEDRNEAHHASDKRWRKIWEVSDQDHRSSDLAESNKELWEVVAKCCTESVGWAQSPWATVADEHYVKRPIEHDIDRFFNGPKSVMVIVGQSGMGKTTLVAHLVRLHASNGHLCFYVGCGRFPRDVGQVEQSLVDLLTRSSVPYSKSFWERIERECAQRGKNLLVILDAANDYNRGFPGLPPRPADLLVVIDELARRVYAAGCRHVKLIVTSRPETWRHGNNVIRAHGNSHAYYGAAGEVAHVLGRFSEEEASAAYELYTAPVAYNIYTAYTDLSETTRYQLRDPLLLALTCRVYSGQTLPAELDTGKVLEAYRHIIEKDCIDAAWLIDWMVQAMFATPQSFSIERDVVGRDGDLAKENPAVFAALDPTRDTNSSWLRAEGLQVRFAYDRFAEHLLAQKLVSMIDRAVQSGRPWLDVAYEAIYSNLEKARRLVIVYRTLRRALRLLQTGVGYAELIERLAASGEPGLTLITSVLASIAMHGTGERDGIDVVRELIEKFSCQLDGGRPLRGAALSANFPVIESVFGILLDEEYDAWLSGHGEKIRQRHRRVLYDQFVWAMGHAREEIAASAIQYLFFLWTRPRLRLHAEVITTQIVEKIQPLSVGSYLLELLTYKISPLSSGRFFPERRLPVIRNTALLFYLVIAETSIDDLPAIASLGRRAIRRLELHTGSRGKRLSYLATLFTPFVVNRIFEHLPHPVNLEALRHLFRHESVRKDLESVLRLLDPAYPAWTRIDDGQLRRLASSENSYVLQFLSFALSIRYERLKEPERTVHLDRLTQLFHEKNPPPQAQYCIALAMYHINYFSDHGTSDSLHRMGEMANYVLKYRKNRFILHHLPNANGRQYSYNIVGTYGRALWRHRKQLDCPGEVAHAAPLQYAIAAFQDAKGRGDFEFYLRVCEDMGLLGILIGDPRDVLSVIGVIWHDLAPSSDTIPKSNRNEIQSALLQGLANIRVLYRSEVDRYLLDVLDEPALLEQVAQHRPDFSLWVFLSWTTEHLLYVCLTRYYETIGRALLEAFHHGLSEKVPARAMAITLERLFASIANLGK